MKIIILMSTYNGQKYIHEQIDSILSQTVAVEILVRDDGSTDDTTKILEEYAMQQKLRWYRGKNLGPGKSFFDLVQNAPAADFYAFSDQDDVWDSDKIECAIKCLVSLPTYVPALYCGIPRPVREDLSVIDDFNQHTSCIALSFGRSLLENIAPGCTFVFNYKALEEFKKYNMEYITIHDWDLFRIIMALDGNVIFDNEAHISYRQHHTNAIGFQANTLQRWYIRVKRFFASAEHNTRYNTACHIKECYYKNMSEKNRQTILIMTEYSCSLLKTLRLVISSDFNRMHKIDTFITKTLALFRKV